MKYSLFVALFVFMSTLYAQKMIIVYDAVAKHTEEVLQSAPQLADNEVTYRYSLSIDGTKTLFKRDSLKATNVLSNYKEYWERESIFKDHENDVWLKSSGRYKEGTAYRREISDLISRNSHQWRRSGREKKLLGISVIEVKGANGTAWYAPDIPIPDGPQYGVFGLPGLVLEYETTSGHWLAVDMIFPNNIKIVQPQLSEVSDESKIRLSLYELSNLSEKEAITISSSKALNRWLKFAAY